MDQRQTLKYEEAISLVSRYKQAIAHRFPQEPKVMMFGSYCKGYANPDSEYGKSSIFRALAKHEPTKFCGDYTQVPRGRVAWNIDKFIVFVGQWAKDKEEELTELIEKYFALPYFEFRYDEHWDLGHGWWLGDL
ncbi:MAG: hypothetical protein IKO26_08540 [Paludibacteraceae bacterium]|nr:hypothetical protein [Paludibacteraceae bacterium]